MNCPICNKELQLTDAFCPNCGFEIHIYPANDATKAFEKTREEKYKDTWKALNDSKTEVQKLEIQSQKIQQKLDEKQKELDDSIKDLSDKLSLAHLENSRLEAQLKEKQEGASQFQKTIKKLQEQIGDYLNQITQRKTEKDEWKSKCDQLSKELSEKQNEIEGLKAELKNNQGSQLLGIVSIKNKVTNVLTYLPVFTGENTYGTDKEEGQNHHQIKMRVRGDVLKPKMFSVQIDNDRAIVYPIDGICIICDGLPVSNKGKLVLAQQSLFIGDVLEIHVSKI